MNHSGPVAHSDDAHPVLLAVDLGLRSGLAAFDGQGGLRWYRSTNFGQRARLKRGVAGVIKALPSLQTLVLEGDRRLGEVWIKAVARRDVEVIWVTPETWRAALMTPRDRRSGQDAKRTAIRLARRCIEDSPAPNPTTLRHDAAEAILIGHWAVRTLRGM